MKRKKQKTIILAILFVVIIVSGLFIFAQVQSDKSKFIGTWESEDGNFIYTFYANGTGEFRFIENRFGTWEIHDGKLIIKSGVITTINDYIFYNDDRTLRIDNLNFTKI